MIKNFNKVRIVNCKVREREGLVVKKLLERQKENAEISIAFDPDMTGAWKTYKKALDVQDNADWLILTEDDLSFPVDILQRIDHVLNFAPKDSIIFFYVPTNNQTKYAYDLGHKVAKTKYNFWTQFTAFPKKHREGIVNTGDIIYPPESDSGDGRVKKYMHLNNVTAFYILPSLIQHLAPFRSALGYGGVCGCYTRQSFCYEPNSDTYKIDWEREFANPYIDKTARGLIGFEGYENGLPLENFNIVNGAKNDKQKKSRN